MKIFLSALAVVAIVCISGLLLARAAEELFTGQSFPVPVRKNVTVIVPFSVP